MLITTSRGKVCLIGPELPNWLLIGWLMADTDFLFSLGGWDPDVAGLSSRYTFTCFSINVFRDGYII
jgi:hypothetical protein